MTRFVPVTVLVMLLAASRVAGADAGDTFPSGAKIVFEQREILDPTSSDTNNPFTKPEAESTELLHFFNLAHCNCARATQTTSKGPGSFRYLVHANADTGSTIDVSLDFWVGTDCTTTDLTMRGNNCLQLGSSNSVTSSISSIDSTPQHGDVREFNLYQVVNAKLNSNVACINDNNVTAPIWALAKAVPTTTTGQYDTVTTIPAGTLSGETATSGVDTEPPPFPTGIRATGGDQAIHLTWTPPSSVTDVALYQALCALMPGPDSPDGDPATLGPSNDPQYVTTASVCAATSDVDPDPAIDLVTVANAPGTGEMPAGAPTGAFANLDDSYICGEANSSTSDSLTIGGLENGVRYRVILVSVDRHGNYHAGALTTTVTPVPSTDFWEDLHDRDGNLEGGLCLLNETYGGDSDLTRTLRAFRDDTLGASRAGRWLTGAYYATLGQMGGAVHGSLALRIAAGVALAPAVAVALLWHGLTLPGLVALIAAAWWLGRRRARVAAWARRLVRTRAMRVAAAAAVLVLGAGRAHAGGGGGYRPYWEDNDPENPEAQSAADDGAVDWRVGFRLGPYTPAIDDQVGGTRPGPFEQMFGKSQHMLTTLDVDRVLWARFGQLGVGLSVGYWQKTARAFVEGSSMTDAMRPRGADHNAFHMIPTALTAFYRFTMLDDEYGIPVVPYVRGGLSYYFWWITVANGDFAKICDNGIGVDQKCGNKAYGASLGVQGSIGLSLRAERIDASAAMSMRQSGIQHAGIFGELSFAKVDGFGSDKKLSVGDATWFAGVDFEF